MFRVEADRHSFELDLLEQVRFRVDRYLLMRKHEEWFRREAFIRQAYSSTMIENPTISEEERSNAESDLSITRADVANYGETLGLVDFLSNDKDLLLNESTIRQVHWILMRGVRDSHFLPGEYRRDTNWIEEGGSKAYQPPHQSDVPPLMRELVVALRESELHPVLKAGVAHLQLVAIHPFVDGNGRTARLLATLILQHEGWGFRNLLSLDAYYQRNRDQYITAIGSTLGKGFPQEYDAGPWLEFFCESVLIEARRLESKLTHWQITVDKIHKDFQPLGLLDRQTDGLMYAVRSGAITRRDYVDIAGVSPLTATRDLGVLVDKGLLEPTGSGRNRIYRLSKMAAEASGRGIVEEPTPQAKLF